MLQQKLVDWFAAAGIVRADCAGVEMTIALPR